MLDNFLCDQKFIAESRTFVLIFQFSYVKYLFPATNGHRFVSIYLALERLSCSTWDWKKKKLKSCVVIFLFFTLLQIFCLVVKQLKVWKGSAFIVDGRIWKVGRANQGTTLKTLVIGIHETFFIALQSGAESESAKLSSTNKGNKIGWLKRGKIVQLRHYRGNNFPQNILILSYLNKFAHWNYCLGFE